MKEIKTIGILTSGGDAPGMNAAIRAVTRSAIYNGWRVMAIYRGWQAHSMGNPLAHAILRGYVNKQGHSMPNYHYEDLAHLWELYAQRELQNPSVIVDTNHANSGKQYLEQIRISKEILHNRRYNADIARMVKGLMIESYIEDGAQKIGEGVYGKSITDPCLGWKRSEKLIYQLADLV